MYYIYAPVCVYMSVYVCVPMYKYYSYFIIFIVESKL